MPTDVKYDAQGFCAVNIMHILRITTDFLLGLSVAGIFASLFFMKKKTGRAFFFTCLSLSAVLLPMALEGTDTGGIHSRGVIIIAAAGTALFPVAYTLLAKNYIKIKNKILLYPILILAVTFFAFSLFFIEWKNQVMSLLLIAFSVYMIYFLLNSIFFSKKLYLMLQAGHISGICLSGISFYSGRSLYYSIAIVALFVLTISIFITGYHKKISMLSHHLAKTRQLNGQLAHTTLRLKQKSEQLKMLIQEKDIELMQMSKHASLAEITTGIAHELTQPITGIKGIAQNMIDDINEDEFDALQAVVELLKICTLVDKSSSIIDHIRNFSRKSGMTMLPVDINRIVLDAIDLINLQFKKNNIDIVLILNENVNKICGDRISLEQLVINLLINARDAIIERKKAEHDDYTGKITICTDCTASGVRLIIEDNGTGISQDIVKKIWSPFFTTKRRSNSTGVGLSISNKILKEHNAAVTIDSQPGVGTRFTMHFPLRKESPVSAGS